MVCIQRGYITGSILNRYSLDVIDSKLDDLAHCLETIGFPDVDLKVLLLDNSRTSTAACCEASVCSKAVHIQVTTDVFFSLSTVALTTLIDKVVGEANHPSDYSVADPLAHCLREMVYAKGWEHRDEDPSLTANWSRMDRCVVDAIKMLKDAGLLDDLPEHVFYVNDKYRANTFQRRIYIPIKADEYGTTDARTIASLIYKQYLLPHIVINAIYILKLENYIELHHDMLHVMEMALAEE